jgi:hypothetical protein
VDDHELTVDDRWTNGTCRWTTANPEVSRMTRGKPNDLRTTREPAQAGLAPGRARAAIDSAGTPTTVAEVETAVSIGRIGAP